MGWEGGGWSGDKKNTQTRKRAVTCMDVHTKTPGEGDKIGYEGMCACTCVCARQHKMTSKVKSNFQDSQLELPAEVTQVKSPRLTRAAV